MIATLIKDKWYFLYTDIKRGVRPISPRGI